MRPGLTIREFLNQYQNQLKLGFASTQTGLDREIKLSRQASDTFEAADYFNVIRTSSIVVVGYQELRYINSLSADDQRRLLKTLFRGPVCAIICSHDNILPDSLINQCEQKEVPVFTSELNDSDLLDITRHVLVRALADRCEEHGVYLEVYSVGVFITGKSAVGKSELALALISRGHRFISDDITRFSRIAPDVVEGRSPGLLTDFMEVRGLGIVNIRAMFGANSLRLSKQLRLIVNMVELDKESMSLFDRVGNNVKTRNLLGLDFPEVTLPVAPGRNLAILVEAAARNHILQMNGYNSADDFIQRQRNAIDESL
ncbi:MAG: HPr(Ser) kinase/phosphatase [Pseudomonadota bacterium]